MTLTKTEIEAVLEAKRKVDEHLEQTRHLFVEPESVRMLREQQEQMKDIIDPPALRALREHEEQLRKLVEPSPVMQRFIEQQERINKLAEPAMLKLMDERNAITQALDSPLIRAYMKEETSVQQMMRATAESLTLARNAVSQSVFSAEFVEGVGRIGADYHASASMVGEAMEHIAQQFRPIPFHQDVAKVVEMFRPIDLTRFAESFRHVEEIARAAEMIVGSVRWQSLGDLIGVPDPTALQFETYRLNKSYADFAASTADAPDTVIEVPFMSKVPALAVYSHARVVRSITTHGGDEPVIAIWSEVLEETTEVIETVLPRVSPALLKSWKGGLATTRRRDADWVRQASASLRYVLITTLDTIAPKDTVLADGVDKKHLSEKGQPTRAGQVHWLCRSLKNKTYHEMMVSELESAIEIIDTMNTAVHREEYPEIEEAFERMCVRAEIALRDLLEIFKTRE